MIDNKGALAHLKVLDLSRVLAGPWCTQILADMGADVIKVERPEDGDDTRHWGPPFMPDASANPTDQASYFNCTNRNKRSITINLASSEGQALVRRLAAQSDIVVENFKVGGLKAYGLDYETLNFINPRLIYCSITGFGQTGPYAQRAGYDLMIQAMSGMMSITGKPDQAAGGGPQRVGVALVDLFTGVYAATAILTALQARHHTGQGQYIDMALFDVGMHILANQAAAFLNTGTLPHRQGNSHPSLAPYQDFATADGSFLLAIGNDGQFARFAQAVGRPEWAQDPRFGSNSLRVQHRDALVQAIEDVTRQRSTADWIKLLEDRAVPCGPINNIAQAFDEPQVQARAMVVRQATGLTGPDQIQQVNSVASPLRLSDHPPVQRRAAPMLGQHTLEILEQMGLDPVEIAALQQKAVV